jgi:hypothetical protein
MNQDNWRNNSEQGQWNSPGGFRGHSPRYRGGGGGGGWQQQQSPYPYHHQQQKNYSPRYASTPYRQRGNYSGRRGGGRYNNRGRGGGFVRTIPTLI